MSTAASNTPDLCAEVDALQRQVARLLRLLAQDGAAGERVLSIPDFCERNNISRSFFYKLRQRGIAPRTMHVDGRVLISPEAERDWRLDREAEATTSRVNRPCN